ncbi:MAG: hypothetical protein FWC11_03185 [Firmicutes bacterium]|nr:hypothetical protein [Bacillota bacterium]
MNLKDNLLLSDDVGYFFHDGFSFSNDAMLKVALRHIAIRRAQDDIEKIKPITFHYSSFNYGNNIAVHIDAYKNHTENIFIFDRSSLPQQTSPLQEGWEELRYEKYPILEFLSKAAPTSIYINKELEKVIVFVAKLNEKWVSSFSSSLFRILTWLFPDTQPDDDELILFKAISERNLDSLEKLSNDVCKTIDFAKEKRQRETEHFKKDLHGWGSGAYYSMVQNLENGAGNTRQSISVKTSELAKLIETLNEQTMQLNALRNSPPPNSDDVFEFFDMHRQLTTLKVEKDYDGKHLFYLINEKIEYYDVDEFVKQFKNKHSDLNKAKFSSEFLEIVYGLFALGKGSVKTRCVFKLTGISQLYPEMHWKYGDTKILPHPHLDMGACLGRNSSAIVAYLANSNWSQAVLQSIVATKNINFRDTHVVMKMMRWLNSKLNSKSKLIVSDKGIEMSLSEFHAYLKELTNNG